MALKIDKETLVQLTQRENQVVQGGFGKDTKFECITQPERTCTCLGRRMGRAHTRFE